MTFATVALAELAFVFSVRSPRTAAWRGPRNRLLLASVGALDRLRPGLDLPRAAPRALRHRVARLDRARDRPRASRSLPAVAVELVKAGATVATMTAAISESVPRAHPEHHGGRGSRGLRRPLALRGRRPRRLRRRPLGRSRADSNDCSRRLADRPVGELAEPTAVVRIDVDEELAAARLARNGGRSIAIVDGHGRFVGLVSSRQAVAVLLREHEEDVARLGGFLSRTSQARTAAEEPVHRRLWHRLPWLALGLLGAMGSAGIVAAFEEQLSRLVLLAFFIPAVVYMADAVGTQTEAARDPRDLRRRARPRHRLS